MSKAALAVGCAMALASASVATRPVEQSCDALLSPPRETRGQKVGPSSCLMQENDIRYDGRAYKRGFSDATGDLIVTLDGDHSYPVDAISYLLEAFLHLNVDFLNASRFPVRDSSAMSFKHKIGNLILSLAMSVLYFRWVRDSQSGMWVFRRSILSGMKLEADGMAFSEEIKIEALKSSKITFGEISILYTSRLGEMKLNPWRDGIQNLLFLVKKRFS